MAPPQQPDELGRLGPYRVLKVLGEGGMGVVFLADDPRLRRAIALKVMRPEEIRKPGARDRFLREAQAAARLEHDNIIPIFQVDEDRGIPFIAMPYLKGMTVHDYLTRKGEFSMPQVLRIGRDVARGLAAAHAKGLVHRDIKPANLWLDATAKGRVKILDFGLVQLTVHDERLTPNGAILGTPAYMSPEQAAGLDVTAASDLFSLGAVLYRLATGRRPFTGHSPYAAYASLITETPLAVHTLKPDVMPAFAALVMRLIEKEPARRPQSAAEVAEAISRYECELLVEKLNRESPKLRDGGPTSATDSRTFSLLDQTAERPAMAGRRIGSRWAVAGTVAVVAAAGLGLWSLLAQ